MTLKEKCEGYCLGIESTADDFSVGIATFKGEILANVISAYISPEGGIHPREAAQHHAEVANKVLEEALSKAQVKPKEISVIAFSQGPGLGPCLRTGATVARALASYLEIPLVGVNHCVAHIEIGKLKTGAKDPVTLYVSGGNMQPLILVVTGFLAKRWILLLETVWMFLQERLGLGKRWVSLLEPLLKSLLERERSSFLCPTVLRAWTCPSVVC